jgi:hypothetical protein
MYTRTENTPTSRLPSSAARPPMSSVSVKAARIAMRMSGMNADDNRIASRFAWR